MAAQSARLEFRSTESLARWAQCVADDPVALPVSLEACNDAGATAPANLSAKEPYLTQAM